jgi:broad specificity phosphatase PhoE
VARLYLVRHAQAAVGWSDHLDPGLSERGRAQAGAMAERLAPSGPLPLLTSPMLRARETAAALEAHWNVRAVVEPGVGEVPSPSEDPAERQTWLRRALATTWTDLGPRYTSWRTMVTGLLLGIPRDTVVVTHFVVVNAALGRAAGRDDVYVANVDNASVTVIDNGGHELTVIDRPDGTGAPGQVL